MKKIVTNEREREHFEKFCSPANANANANSKKLREHERERELFVHLCLESCYIKKLLYLFRLRSKAYFAHKLNNAL
jgi:hypothetical protein